MSNRRHLKPPQRPQHPVSAQLAALDGAEIPGGCESCDAYQTVHANDGGADLHRITIHHDGDCPRWAAIRRRSA
jgi:hypothetical protein